MSTTSTARAAAVCAALTLLAVLPAPPSTAAAVVPVDMLGDISTRAVGEGPSRLTAVGSTIFFLQSTPGMGEELWKTDGTGPGTVLVKDIRPGEASSDADSLTAINGMLYFRADDGEHGTELWKSDGSPAGTVMVKDVKDGYQASSWADGITAVGSTVFFGADDGVHGWELWKTDGTLDGTSLVADISPGAGSSGAWNLTELAGALYFNATDGAAGDELWRSDGSSVELVADILPGAGGSSPGRLEVVDLATDGPTLFFEAWDGALGATLWRSDGTETGTELVAVTGNLSTPIVEAGGALYFGAQGELWTSDGTDAGTHDVKDEYSVDNGTYLPVYLTEVGDDLVFLAGSTSDPAIEGFWRTDGTDVGTVRLVAGPYSGYADRGAVAFGGGILFEVIGDGSGSELWTSDGTVPGTQLLKDIRPGAESSEPHELTVLGAHVYFVADDGVVEDELWRTDGTPEGTVLVKDVDVSTASSDPDDFTSIGGTIYFSAADVAHGRELWKSDGTAAGTVLLTDLLPGPDSSSPAELTAVGTTLFFTALPSTGGTSRVLWKSDGTAAGTVQVPVQAFPDDPTSPTSLTAAGGLLYFAARAHNGANGVGVEPWRTDGTAAGTILLKDVWPNGAGAGGGSGLVGEFSYVNSTVLFAARTSVNDVELWTTDGTPSGTTLVKDINELGGSFPGQFVDLAGTTYFVADDGTHGPALWQTDGTTASAVLAADPEADWLSQLTAMGGDLYFTANDLAVPGDYNFELWTSDGTTAGTHRVVDLGPAQYGSSPSDLTVLGGRLYFTADDGVAGRELWRSDGTASGTSLVRDIHPTGAGFTPDPSIATAGGLLFLAADDGVRGSELWQSDGTSAGTELVRDIRPGTGAGLPFFRAAAAALGQLFFSADDGTHGRELWRARATLDTDLDDDGIADDVDTQPTAPSAEFSDVGLPDGKTSGRILSVPSGGTVSVVDAPLGVHITVTTAAANDFVRVQILGRPSSVKLAEGVYELSDPVWDTTLTVLADGPAEIEAPLNGTIVVITVREGASVTFTETVSDSGALTDLVVTPDPGNDEGTVQVNGVDVTSEDVLAFGSFNLKLSRSRPPTTIVLSGTFTTGASSDGVLLLDEQVTLSLGSFAFVLPAGSFAEATGGSATAAVDGATVTVQLKRLKRGAWEVKAAGGPVDLTSPVSVGVRIGDDLGFKTVKLR